MSITNKVIIELSEQLTGMSTESNSANGSVVDRLFDIMDKSSKKQKVDSKALEDGAVYIVGTTGAGKSTLLKPFPAALPKEKSSKMTLFLYCILFWPCES